MLLAIFTLMLLESVIVYSCPGFYRICFGFFEKCSRKAMLLAALLCMLGGMASLAVVRGASAREWEYAGCLSGVLFTMLGLMLFVIACAGETFRQQFKEHITAIAPSRMRSYAVAAFLFNVAAIVSIVFLADF